VDDSATDEVSYSRKISTLERDDCNPVTIHFEDSYASGIYSGSYFERVVAEHMVSFGEEFAGCHPLLWFCYDYHRVLALVSELLLNASLSHLAYSIAARTVHAWWP